MAWTAPATWSVAEVVTAAKMNTHIRDNLNYLKGNAGIIALASGVDSAGTVRATAQTAPASGAGVELLYSGGSGYLLAFDRSAPGFRPFIMQATTIEWDIGATPAMFLDASRNLGINTVTPAGKVHAAGAGGSMLFLSASAVAGSVVTLAAAGTVAAAAGFVAIFDYANSGGTSNIFTTLGRITLGNSNTYVNNDTITVAVTAGGAITVQRTSGTASTHEISMLVFTK